jgi:ABC-type glycerol-3-phosphate transport system substrate-binding protein
MKARTSVEKMVGKAHPTKKTRKTMMKNILLTILMLALTIGGCGKDQSAQPQIDELVFWQVMSDQKGKALQEIVDAYNATNPPIKIRSEFVGDYDTLYRKTMAALLAKRPPDLAMAYSNMVSEYMKYDSVVDLTPYLAAEPKQNVDDYFPAFLEDCRFAAFDNKLLSMPFTKSILLMYYNIDMLKEVGVNAPPATWDEFISVCKAIKAKRGIVPLAFARDASTIDGLIFSFGGQVYDPKTAKPLFDNAATLGMLTLLHDLFDQGLAHETAYNTYDDRNDFVSQNAAFFIRSSTSRPYVKQLVGDKFHWNVAVIPHDKNIKTPQTVLFGPNLCIFKKDPAREKAAWAFVRYFTSPEASAKWTLKSGYLPVRKSALNQPIIKTFLSDHPSNGQTVDIIPFAHSEPSVQGWQEVRTQLEKTAAQVITKNQTPEEAAKDLQTQAIQMLKK